MNILTMPLVVVQCCCVLVLCLLAQCQCYIITPLYCRLHQVQEVRIRRFPLVCSSTTSNGDHYLEETPEIICQVHDKEENESSSLDKASGYNILSRRNALGSLAAIGGSISTTPLLLARAAALEPEEHRQEQHQSLFNVRCLADLPPIPNGFVRVYLCRHGQTENNRLNLMQGARIDPPLNDNGMAQAERLGMALSHAGAGAVPDMIHHSKLLRARQTAKIASLQFNNKKQHPPKLATLATLGEVDFGEIAEGLPVEQVRSQLVATYAGWATGNLDMSMPAGGESGRQVLGRVENALNSLLQQATSRSSRCIAVITHSTYLRMLLAVAKEQPLFLASTMEQKNCCINVVDLKADDGSSTKFIGPNSRLFTTVPVLGAAGGPLFSKGTLPTDFGLTIPVCQVVRINEKRHLGGLV